MAACCCPLHCPSPAALHRRPSAGRPRTCSAACAGSWGSPAPAGSSQAGAPWQTLWTTSSRRAAGLFPVHVLLLSRLTGRRHKESCGGLPAAAAVAAAVSATATRAAPAPAAVQVMRLTHMAHFGLSPASTCAGHRRAARIGIWADRDFPRAERTATGPQHPRHHRYVAPLPACLTTRPPPCPPAGYAIFTVFPSHVTRPPPPAPPRPPPLHPLHPTHPPYTTTTTHTHTRLPLLPLHPNPPTQLPQPP